MSLHRKKEELSEKYTIEIQLVDTKQWRMLLVAEEVSNQINTRKEFLKQQKGNQLTPNRYINEW